jgi:hypothetical protein
MMEETPMHLAAPFSFNAKGEAATVEQGSPADIVGCTLNVCVCLEGFREDLPEFGIPELPFQETPLDTTLLEEAIRRWEPEATAEAIEQAIAGARLSTREISVTV